MAEHPSVELYRLVYQRILLLFTTHKYVYRTSDMILWKKEHEYRSIFHMCLVVGGEQRIYKFDCGAQDGIYETTRVTPKNHDAKIVYIPHRRKSHNEKSMILLRTMLCEIDRLECYTTIIRKT